METTPQEITVNGVTYAKKSSENEQSFSISFQQGEKKQPSLRSRTIAAALCFFLGYLGVHRFYVGKLGTGLLMLFTLGGYGIWAFIDFIVIIAGDFKDKKGLTLTNW